VKLPLMAKLRSSCGKTVFALSTLKSQATALRHWPGHMNSETSAHDRLYPIVRPLRAPRMRRAAAQ
jgi:hypothetical protein